MITNWQQGWLLFWLALWTVWDIRYRVIYRWQGLLVLAVGVVWQLAAGQLFSVSVAGGALLGGVFWGFSWLTRDQFGKGDALVILCLGTYCGFAVTLSVVTIGLFLASVWAVYLLLVEKRSSRQAIPLIPFLTAGYVLAFLAGGGG